MKHLKNINEYFDYSELKKKMPNLDNDEIKKMVSDDRILYNPSILSNISYDIKHKLPYFNNWDFDKFEGGLSITRGYDYYIKDNESVLAKMSIHLKVDEQDTIKRKGNEKYFFEVTYASFIILLEGEDRPLEEYTHLFNDEYKGISNVGGGDVKVNYKLTFGMKELINFLKKELIPQIEKTVDEFEKLTRSKLETRSKNTLPKNIN